MDEPRPVPVGAALMPRPAIAKIERVPLREVWKHEAHNLTTWLEQNIDVLNDVLDLNLTNVEREQAAGNFSVDLVAEGDSCGTAGREEPLGRSHKYHLGQLNYCAAVTE